MNEFKARILTIGLTYKKVSELVGISPSHLCKAINDNIGLSEKVSDRLGYVLTQYENIRL
jgi:hypothetical protein